MTEPPLVAYRVVAKMMEIGAKKHGDKDWRKEDKRMRILKAIRHLTTKLLILDGYLPPDGENHAENAECQTAMFLTQEEEEGAKPKEIL